MSDNTASDNSIDKRIERIHELLDEVIDNHVRMQELLSEAIVKVQTDRGVRDIERFLDASER